MGMNVLFYLLKGGMKMSIYEKIKAFRIARDMTWPEIAEKIGIGYIHLQHIMSGRMKAGPRVELKIRIFYRKNKKEIDEVSQFYAETMSD